MLDISLDDNLEARFWSVLANDDPEAIAWLLPRDNVLLGLADSGAHVSQLCDACFSTDLLGNWVREQGRHAPRTGDPQADRRAGAGLRVGRSGHASTSARPPTSASSIPQTVAPGPLRRIHDFPADGERLTADAPLGVTHVLVNGVPIRTDGVADEEGLAGRPGVSLRR